MECPKCGSPLRASKQKKDYFLCDTCRTRMSLTYIKKMAGNSADSGKKTLSNNTHKRAVKIKKKRFPVFLLIILLLAVCAFFFIHFRLYEKIALSLSSTESSATLAESMTFEVLDYEIISDNVEPTPSYGSNYMLINIQITNSSSENLSIDSMHNFECYVDGEKLSYSEDFAHVITYLNYTPLNNDLASGQSTTGYLCYEIPLSWKTLNIQYSPIIWSSTTLSYEIKNTD